MTLSTLTLAAVILTFLMIVVAVQLRTRGDLRLGFSNRDAMPAPTPIADRADRATKNMLENLVLFVALVVAVGGHNPGRAVLGAEIFVAARIVYWPIYLAGISGLRTAAWSVGLVGLVILGSALL
ncbi:MAG TPA: MAPEG family protein [Kofleriaceae bacterium]|nr:MAPEG family protein [Kofleriaceae bacterium]